jgi:competence protein ComEC
VGVGLAARQGITDQPGLDARLLVPALLAWISVAAMLSLRPIVLTLCAAGLAGMGALLMNPRWSQRSWVNGIAITLLATALCLVAAAAHSAVREAGLVPGLAVQRASATLEGVVVSDPRVIPELLT